MHGAGNDFVVLDLRGRDGAADDAPPSAALCRNLADRHIGIGCDQLLTVESPRSAGALASYRIWNSDASSAQQCGNGARCVAAWVLRDHAQRGLAPPDNDRFALDSPTGTHSVHALGGDRFRIAMGVPEFAPAAIPLVGFENGQDGYLLEFGGRPLRFGAVSMGNPHALIEVPEAATAPVALLGAYLQGHRMFPDSVNVGFAEVASRERIKLRVFERGVGETLACGSGACAAAAILMRRDRIDREVDVVLPGGTLRIAWPDDASAITMAGPAAFVFEGEWWR
ncbi:MAG: diaminopimelate epimerase [Xanthomonadaceae bacterium]|nr:diaminopimelate epimerase [Xanthomonadaceae bacterium]